MNTITIPSNRIIKKFARQMFKGRWFEAILVVAIAQIISSVPVSLVNTFAPESEFFSFLLEAYVLIVSGPISVGVSYYFISTFRNQRLSLNAFSRGFDCFAKAVLLFLLVSLKVMLWSFLFVIPGILAAIRYSQAFFILADDPRKAVNQCIEESKSMMRLYTGRYVLFLLGYLGWFILSAIPTALITNSLIGAEIFAEYSYEHMLALLSSVTTSPWMIVSDLTKILLDVYFYMGAACFFDIISGKLVLSRAEDDQPAEDSTDL